LIDAQQVHIFDTLTQADGLTTRRFGSTGLDLAITRRLAELMGGNAGTRPRPGGGSIYWFTAWRGRAPALP
jgi:signal transduction histidine kinase